MGAPSTKTDGVTQNLGFFKLFIPDALMTNFWTVPATLPTDFSIDVAGSGGTVVVTSTGPDDATGLTILDSLPAGVTFSAATQTSGTYNSGTGAWTIGSLSNGAKATLTLDATVNAGTGGTTITNTASVSALTEADPNSPNDSDSAAINPVAVPEADLSIAKVSSPTVVNAGANLTYTITVTNNGPDTATTVTVTDTLPTSVTWVSTGAGCGSPTGVTVTCTTASIANGASQAFTITVTAPALFGSISNAASVSAASPTDPASSNNSITLVTTVNVPVGVPGVTFWGLGALAVLLAGAVLFARRRAARGRAV